MRCEDVSRAASDESGLSDEEEEEEEGGGGVSLIDGDGEAGVDVLEEARVEVEMAVSCLRSSVSWLCCSDMMVSQSSLEALTHSSCFTDESRSWGVG